MGVILYTSRIQATWLLEIQTVIQISLFIIGRVVLLKGCHFHRMGTKEMAIAKAPVFQPMDTSYHSFRLLVI